MMFVLLLAQALALAAGDLRLAAAAPPRQPRAGADQKYTQQYAGGLAAPLPGQGRPAPWQAGPAAAHVPQKAEECGTEADLNAWYAHQVDQVKKGIPEKFQQVPLESVNGLYEERLAQLQGRTIAAAPAPSGPTPSCFMPQECKTVQELYAWYAKSLDQVKTGVPEAFQHFPLANIDKQFKARLAQLQGKNVTAAAAPQGQAQMQPGQAQTPLQYMSPAQCRTEAELRAWYAHHADKVKTGVPVQYQNFALSNVDEQFKLRLAQLREKDAAGVRAPAAPAASAGASAAPRGDDVRKYLQQHAGDFQKCTSLRQHAVLPGRVMEMPVLLASAGMCKDERDLLAWRACQVAEIQENVPKTYRGSAVESVRRQFAQRLAQLRLAGSGVQVPEAATGPGQLPVLFALAESCPNEQELRFWRAHQLAQINAFVPVDFRRFAGATVEDVFNKRLARLARASEPANGAADSAMMRVRSSGSSAARSASTAGSADAAETRSRSSGSTAAPSASSAGAASAAEKPSGPAAVALAASSQGPHPVPLPVLVMGGLALPPLLAMGFSVVQAWRAKRTEEEVTDIYLEQV